MKSKDKMCKQPNKKHSQNCLSSPELMTNVGRIKHKVTRKQIPLLGKLMDIFWDLNPVMKSMVFLTIVLWKFYIAYYFYIRIISLTGHVGTSINVSNAAGSTNTGTGSASKSLNAITAAMGTNALRADSRHMEDNAHENTKSDVGLANVHSTEDEPIRVLHIVTALAEYNNGYRGTKRGEDRLQNVFIPVLKSSVESMLEPQFNFQVDVYLVLGWKLLPERRKLIEDALPEGVGLQIWDDATPLGYDRPKTDVKLKPVTRGLARQHRFVIKDKLMHYDLFSVFEDDMRASGEHLHHYLEMSRELERLAEEAPDTLPKETENPVSKQSFSGQLSKTQLKRMMPGFIRVEVLLDQENHPAQRELDPLPVDHDYETADGETEEIMFDPAPCCHVPGDVGKLPPSPGSDEIMLWETRVKGTVVRELPKGGTDLLDWVMLQPGPKVKMDKFIGGYWSGRNGDYGDDPKPGGGDPQMIAQQGGWMATRDQLMEMHLHQCPDGFFNPFEGAYKQDGLTLMNVEFWSGGYSVFSGSKAGCQMQRVISLKPEHFSKHFLYHTGNNKQRTLPNARLLKANDFMGQINTVVKRAKATL